MIKSQKEEERVQRLLGAAFKDQQLRVFYVNNPSGKELAIRGAVAMIDMATSKVRIIGDTGAYRIDVNDIRDIRLASDVSETAMN